MWHIWQNNALCTEVYLWNVATDIHTSSWDNFSTKKSHKYLILCPLIVGCYLIKTQGFPDDLMLSRKKLAFHLTSSQETLRSGNIVNVDYFTNRQMDS